jgi:hypothetical protein
MRFPRLLPFASLLLLPAAFVAACNAQVAKVLSSDPDGGGGDGGPGVTTTASCTADPECNADPAISALYGTCVAGSCVCHSNAVVTANGKCAPPGTTPDGGPNVAVVPPCEDKGGICATGELPDPPGRRPARAGEAKCADAAATCWLSKGGMAPVCYNPQGCNGNNAVSAQWGDCNFGICFCKAGFTVQPDGRCNIAPPPTCEAQLGTCRASSCMATELLGSSVSSASCPDDADMLCCNATSSCAGGAQEAAGAGWVPVAFECCSKTKGTTAPICVNGWQTCEADASPVPKGSICN